MIDIRLIIKRIHHLIGLSGGKKALSVTIMFGAHDATPRKLSDALLVTPIFTTNSPINVQSDPLLRHEPVGKK